MLLAGAALATGCASLPEVAPAQAQPAAVRLEGARGPLSRAQSAAILEGLKAQAGGSSMLDRHLAVEQAFTDSPIVVGNRATLLKDGPATYRAMFAAMRRAHDHINLESYIVEGDDMGRKFADLLIEKRRQGVKVRLLYDAVGSIGTPAEFFANLDRAGVQTLQFNPLNPLAGAGVDSPDHRDHRKLLIVDGRIAFLGGINVSDVYSSGSASVRRSRSRAKAGAQPARSAWRDTHVQIEGPVVAEYQKLFLATWKEQKGAVPEGADFYPRLEPAGSDIVHAIGSSADASYNQNYVVLVSAVNSAESHIWLTNAYFVPDPQLLQALKDAAGRGVDVRLILPSHTDFWAVFHAGRAHYTELLRAGVKIYERQGALLHSKTALIDGVWSCVGSTNLDWRSFLHNNEVDAVVLGEGFASQMRAMFLDDLAESRQIDLETWKRRGLATRFKEWSAGLWQYWL